jgi:hypothetical protein
MRYHEITEAPIEDLTHVGDWEKSSSFRHAQDRKLLTNPKAIQKITKQWEKTPVDFNVYLVNNADGTRHGEIGEVSQEWLEQNLPNTAPYFKYNPNAVNILYMNNSGSARVPMTGWVLAHRLGHALNRYDNKYSSWNGGMRRQFQDFTDALAELYRTVATILNDGYGYKDRVPSHERDYDKLRATEGLIAAFYQQIGTMRSARTGNLRDEREFILELLAQYMLTGRIKFNPIPKSFKYGRHNYVMFRGPEGDMEYYNGMLEDLADSLEHMFLNLLGSAVGKILVM